MDGCQWSSMVALLSINNNDPLKSHFHKIEYLFSSYNRAQTNWENMLARWNHHAHWSRPWFELHISTATCKQLPCFVADQNPIMVKNDTRCGPLTPFCASFLFLSYSDPHGPSNSVLKWSKSKVVVGALPRSLMGTLCPRLLQVEWQMMESLCIPEGMD